MIVKQNYTEAVAHGTNTPVIPFPRKDYDLDSIGFKEKYQNLHNGVLLDVRTVDEYSRGTILGAHNLDCVARDFYSRVQKLDREKVYFLFCRSGKRSGNAAAVMEKSGLKVFNLIGGIGAWKFELTCS